MRRRLSGGGLGRRRSSSEVRCVPRPDLLALALEGVLAFGTLLRVGALVLGRRKSCTWLVTALIHRPSSKVSIILLICTMQMAAFPGCCANNTCNSYPYF